MTTIPFTLSLNSLRFPVISLAVLFALLFAGCNEFDENKANPTATFTKIFDSDDFSTAFRPYDLIQTEDGGYLFFGTIGNFSIGNSDERPYLLKVDSTGDFQWEHKGKEPQTGTLENLIVLGSAANKEYYYFCRDQFSALPLAFKIDLTTGTVTEQVVNAGSSFTFPLSVATVKDTRGTTQVLLQGYNSIDNITLISKLDTKLNLLTDGPWEYEIEKEADSLVIRQVNGFIDPLPFMTGGFEDNPNFFYFNGFRNFKFSFNFIDAASGEYTGSIDGSAVGDDVIKSATHISANTFAMSRLTNGDHSLFPFKEDVFFEAETSVGSPDFNVGAIPFLELADEARIVPKKITIADQDFILYSVDTQSGQLALLAFNTLGELKGITYLGRGNKVTTGNFTVTKDNGLAILGKIFVAGRFPRFVLFKFSEEELKGFVGL